jgi:hypothetical protein
MKRAPRLGRARDDEPTRRADTLPTTVAGRAGMLLALQRSAGNAAVSRLVAQRAVNTSGGEWDTDKYDLLKDVDGKGNVFPPAQGVRGADIVLRFKPDAGTVDAELIGLSQSVIAFVNNTPTMTASQAAVAIPHSDAKPAGTGAGETDEGAAIDQLGPYNSPMYATKAQTSTTLADPVTEPQWGQHGFHYTNAAKAVKHQDALLKDTAMRANAQKDSRHIFETTALATKGVQTGTYYGSVRWGWRTDAAEAFTKLPLEVVSQGVPSSTFMKAAEIWNKGKSTSVGEHVTTAPVVLKRPGPAGDVTLVTGTRLQIIEAWHPPLLNGTVKVMDGPHVGTAGDVGSAQWGSIADERS